MPLIYREKPPSDTISRVLTAMRTIREKSDFWLNHSRERTPMGNRIPVGGAHIEGFIKGESLAVLLSELAKGKTLSQSVISAKQEAKLIIKNWNSKREYQVRYSDITGESEIEWAERLLTQATISL